MLDLIRPLVVSNPTKIVLLSLDGLGGLPRPETGRSELETAGIPNLAPLAPEAARGLHRLGRPPIHLPKPPRMPARPRSGRRPRPWPPERRFNIKAPRLRQA